MIELLFVAQAFRNPIQAIARRWYCRSLFRASRGAALQGVHGFVTGVTDS